MGGAFSCDVEVWCGVGDMSFARKWFNFHKDFCHTVSNIFINRDTGPEIKASESQTNGIGHEDIGQNGRHA